MTEKSDSLIVTEDGSLELGDNVENIVFHQDLNVFLVTTNDNNVRVFDPHSSHKLADVSLSKYVNDPGGKIQCMYHGETGGIILSGGRSFGVRQDHQGVLLLHTILQTQVTSPDEIITLEILLSEAIQLQQVFSEVNCVAHANEVKEALAQALLEPLSQSCSNPKVGKWHTVCLSLPLSTLRSVCSSLVGELRHLAYFIPALSLTSALCHRLNHLAPPLATDDTELDKEAMFSEAARLATFTKWPHMNYKWALPDQMAQAGFFHQPVASDDDRAMCFICNVCLVYWEPTDEPWSEHERHSPSCPYVKGEYTHNVPLSVTYATSPALSHSDRAEPIHRISESNSKLFMASATISGNIVIWNVSKQLKKEITFLVDPSDSTILDKHFSDTIGYTDIPLQPVSLKEVWQSPPSGNETNPSSTSNESSKLMLKLYPSVGQTPNSTVSNSSQDKVVNHNTQFEYSNDSDKEFPESSTPISQFINISDILGSDSSPSELNQKSPPEIPISGGHKPMTPVEEINDLDCLDLEEVLQLANLMDDSGSTSSVKNSSPHTNGTQAHVNGDSKPTSKNADISLEDLSDELFAPPRPSHDVRVTSLCIFSDPMTQTYCSNVHSANASKSHRACLVVGVGLRRYDLFSNASADGLVKAMNDVNQADHKEKPLDIMTLENSPDSLDNKESCESIVKETDDEFSDRPITSNINNSSSNPKNFVPYLLVYDLSQLVQPQNNKEGSKTVPQGPSKKSSRKVVPSTCSLVKIKGDGELSYEEMCVNFPVKYKVANKSFSLTAPQSEKLVSKRTPKCAQCIPLPHKLNKLKLQLVVDRILISPCGQYLLVSLQQFRGKKWGTSTSGLRDKETIVGGFILYKIQSSEVGLSIQEESVNSNLFINWNLVAKELAMIPNMTTDENYDDEIESNLVGVVCMDGCLRILSLLSLEYVQVVNPPEHKFNNITYCHSLERLCVTREDGKVLLMQIKGNEDLSDDPECCTKDGSPSPFNASSKLYSFEKELDLQSHELLVHKGISEENLDKCIQLTLFQPGCPKMVATVPPCWSEVIQAQKKRRNPQHLQHQSEDVDSARTWRLESDRYTDDEHMLDLLLPLSGGPGSSGPPQIGHIDVKLNFVNGTSYPLPKIQITLLKQNLKSTRRNVLPKPLDNFLDFPENPVLTRDFLLAHKAEILCGPVTVNQYIDLSGQGANLTLTSPDLFTCKGRSFLIHIIALKPNEKEDKRTTEDINVGLDLLPQYVPPQSSTFFDKLSSSTANMKRGEAPKGCDVIHELTLTVHCCTKTNIPHERLQRLAMIDIVKFHSDLIGAIVNPSSSQHIQHRALDILLWILSIHTASEQSSSRREELLHLIKEHLTPFMKTCILGGDRSLAHKITKIILTSLESFTDPDCRKEMGNCVLASMLECLSGIAKCKAAGAVYWFFSLLNHVKWCDPLATVNKITELVSVTSEVLSQKMNPFHSILETKFGLEGMPFEKELFDTFPPLLMKQSTPVSHNPTTTTGHNQHHNSTTTNGNNNLSNNQHIGFSWNKNDCPNLLWFGSNQNVKSSFGGVLSPLGGDNSDLGVILGHNGVTLGLTPQIGGLCGLFEVEPLHFTLYMASDGTKMERVFSGSSYATSPYIVQPTSTLDSDQHLPEDNSKVDSLSMAHMQLNKAIEDMEHMVIKNHAVTLLLSKKAKKSYLEKLKKSAKQKASKVLHQNSTTSISAIETPIQNGGIDPSAKEGESALPTASSTPSTVSSDASPEGGIPNNLMEKQALGNSVLPNELLGNIVEGVANTIFNTSMLNSSINLLANVTNDIPDQSMVDTVLSLESQGVPIDKVIDILGNIEEGSEKEGYNEMDFMAAKLNLDLAYFSEIDKMFHDNLNLKVGESSKLETDKDKMEKSLEELSPADSGKTSTASTASTLTKETKEGGVPNFEEGSKPVTSSSGLPYQQLLSIPPQQMIVIERMHSGARRFVILDFGAPIILTDVIIPACSDLVSLTIDIWLNGEETDGERLAVASDIGLRPLILADLQPPPLCRFLKVTTLGRYGMVTSQCKIPVGAFYGHTVILPWYLQPSHSNITITSKKMAKNQLSILSSMVEDVSCRYSLACSKLKALLQPYCMSSSSGNEGSNVFGSILSGVNSNANTTLEKKIYISYQECLTEQQHLNLILSVMRRLQKFIGLIPSKDILSNISNNCAPNSVNNIDHRKELENCSSDQLSSIVQALLNCLLTLSFPPPNNCVQMKLLYWCGPTQAKALIEDVCIRGPKGAQVAVVSLLARLCTAQPWWGEFLASTLVSLFSARESSDFPATRLFALMTFLGQKSVQCGRGTQVIDAVLQSLLTQLQRGSPNLPNSEEELQQEEEWLFGGEHYHQIDPTLISWLLLFLSLCLDLITNPKGPEDEKDKHGVSGRWSWLTAESSLQKKGNDPTKEAPKDSRDLLRKRLVHHKQQLVNLESATKSFDEVLTSLGNVINPKMFKQSEQVFKKIQKQHALKHYKDLCSIQRNETNSLRRLHRNRTASSNSSNRTIKEEPHSAINEVIAPIDRVCCLTVIKALVNLLMNTQYPCSVDTFLLTCKVIGGLVRVTRPSLKVGEFLNEEQLVTLLTHSKTLDSTWGSPWAIHAVTCLLQDVLEGERHYGSVIIDLKSSEVEEMNVTDNNKECQSGKTQDWNESRAETSVGSPFPPQVQVPLSNDSEAACGLARKSHDKDSSLTQYEDKLNVSSVEEPNQEQGPSSSSSSDEKSKDDPKSNEKGEEPAPSLVEVKKSTVSAVTSVNQSATAISPPAVNVATSHFATIEEEEGPGKYTFLESDESSASDDMIEFIADFQNDLHSLSFPNSTEFSNIPTSDSYNILPNSLYCSVTNHGKHGGSKESRVNDLITAPLALHKHKMGADHSTAVDARLESGISLTAELRIHMMNAIHASRLCSAISAPLQVTPNDHREREIYGNGNLKESVELLSRVFQNALSQMAFRFEGNQLESILEIWLSLNLGLCGGEYSCAIVPVIPLHPHSISALLTAVARSHSISIRCWCLILQTLTLCSNLNPPEESTAGSFQHPSNLQDPFNPVDLSWMSQAIIADRNFLTVLLKLLSGHYSVGSFTRSDVVGSTLTSLFEDFLVRLEVRSDVISVDSSHGNNLKLTLLKLVMRLLEPDAPLARGLGPLDLQKTLLTIMLSMHYSGLQKSHIPLTIINSVASIVNGFLCSNQEVQPGSPEPNSSVLGGLFASVLGSDGQQGPVPTRKMTLCALLNLSRKLLEIPLEPVKGLWFQGSSQVSSTARNDNYQERYLTDSIKLEQRQMELTSVHSSQTDEHKAMNPSPTSGSPGEEASRDIASSSASRSSFDSSRGRVVSYTTKDCCHNQPTKDACIADSVLENNETMNLLVDSLRCSESNSVVPMNLIGIVSGDVSETLGIGKTLPDALYQVLLALNQKATKSDLLLNAILRYIRPGNLLCQPVFSEALYCFYTQVLDCEKHLKKFAAMNGPEIMWENLVKCVGTSSGPQTGLVSSVMNHLSPSLPLSTMTAVSHKRIDPSTGSPSTVESSNTKGLYNFAPLAVVTSSNPTARPADALVKSTQFFQRTKSPPWSYHFYPEENWVDLNLTLPCPILLHEIQLQPHTMSLGMCPSGISLETSVEGGCSIPVTGLVCTAGLTCIHVVLRHPIVASVVVLRLHRPRDQSTLGLTHLKLLGTTTFKNSLKGNNRDYLWEHGPQKSSYWWLRLVDHCMFDVPGGFSLMLESGSRVEGVMEAMVTLLATSSSQLNAPLSSATKDNLTEALTNNNCQLINTLSSTLIENTTLALVTYNQDLLHGLVKCLFRHPLMMQSTGSSSVDAAIALLCMVSSTTEGVKLLIDWFSKMVEHQSTLPSSSSAQINNMGNNNKIINHKILHCFASILWNVTGDVANLITDSLFKKVYNWCEKATGPIKEGLDCVMGALCKVQPHLFTQLLLFMGFLTVIDSSSTSLTDDRKDREAEIRAACTDDMKESTEGYGLNGEGRLILQDPSIISMTPHHLQSISFAAQSPSAIHLMLDSGFPLLLVHGILEWCKAELLHQVESCTTPNVNESSTDFEKANLASSGSQTHAEMGETSQRRGSGPLPIHDALPPLSTSMVVHTLKALTTMCSEMPMKDWLGSGEGSVFWIPLLTVLGDPVMHGSEMTMRNLCGLSHSDYSQVEDTTIQLMKVCCNNHDNNRKLLAATLCHLIQRQNTPPPGGLTYLHSLSGFTRRLVLQILLETDCVLVHVTSTFCLSHPPLHSLPPQAKHPKFGAGNKTRLMYLPVTTSIEDVIKMVTDWWQQGGTPSQSAAATQAGESGSNMDAESGSYKKEIREVGLELVDKLSVAAGVTAKDKRMKDKGPLKNKRKETITQSKQIPVVEKSRSSSPLPMYGLIHEELLNGNSIIPEGLSLAQVIAALWHHGSNSAQDLSQLKFNLVFAKDTCQECSDGPIIQTLLKTEPKPSMLSVFSSQGGLSILAQHMALLYPDSSHQYVSSFSSKNGGDEKKEKTLGDDIGFHIDMYYSVLPDYMCGNNLNSSPGISRNHPMGYFGTMPIPPHALGSFTLFLRLPGYAETLLTDNVKACCLLRLALGVYDGMYEENSSTFVGSLATLPFQVLEVLLKSTPLTTDDGLMLRKMCLSTGVLHLILACLAALSHQDGPDVITSLQHPNVPVGLLVATAKGSCPSQRQSGLNSRNDGDRCHYWAKGTGFGTGSTSQSWNVEQALVKQKMEEQHVVWLIKLLAQYINPGGNLPEDILKLCEEEVKKLVQESKKDTRAISCLNSTSSFSIFVPHSEARVEETRPTLPSEIYELFVKAGLVKKICSYLSNDSVLDMSRHVPLYQALMALVRGIAVTPSLSQLFLSNSGNLSQSENEDSQNPHLPSLLTKMKTTVNTYVAKLKWKGAKSAFASHSYTTRKIPVSSAGNVNDEKSSDHQNFEMTPEETESEDQGLSLLVPDIQLSTKVVEIVMERLNNQETADKKLNENSPSQEDSRDELTPTDIYLNAMKPLQFDSFEMIVEDEEREIRFVVPYHYENLVRNAGEVFNPKRMKRLAQEAVTLSTSLPLSYSSSVFVRTDMDRLDVMKVLITGPEDTPYANGCFEFDVYFTNNYPNSPLYINLQTTGEKRVRFNPNLYQDGKVCLSILNTWHGRPEEKWNPQTSSLLQVLVSIQSLILVPEPYFNEPGYERSRGSQAALHNSQEYDANIKAATIRWAILNQLRNPSPCFKEVIDRHFWLKRKDILTQVENWIVELETLSKNKRAGRVIPHHALAIKKLYQLLLEDFGKMSPPKGLENLPTSSLSPRTQIPTLSYKEDSDSKDGKAPIRHRIRKTSRADIFGGNKLPVIDEGGSKTLDLSQSQSPPQEEWEDPSFQESFVSCLSECDALSAQGNSTGESAMISDVKGAEIDWGFNWEESQMTSDSGAKGGTTSKCMGESDLNKEWVVLGKSKNTSSNGSSLSTSSIDVSNGVPIDETPPSSVLGASQNSLEGKNNSNSHSEGVINKEKNSES